MDLSPKIQVGIVGAGVTAHELLGLLLPSSYADLSYITSNLYQGQTISVVLPSLAKFHLSSQIRFSSHPTSMDEIPDIDVLFLACPEEITLAIMPRTLDRKIKIIDIGAAFRIKDISRFEAMYQVKHTAPQLMANAIYGLTEVYREQIKNAHIIANPGCYATVILLSLWIFRKYINPSMPIICDAKSGTSGAGARTENNTLNFASVYEDFRAYKVGKHQHVLEIQEQLHAFLNVSQSNFYFTPHLLPVSRGIFATIYLTVDNSMNLQSMDDDIQSLCNSEQFIRYYESPEEIRLSNVQHTNFFDFSYYYDKSNQCVIITAAIDNLVKGAVGQAVQNMNTIFGLKETEHLII